MTTHSNSKAHSRIIDCFARLKVKQLCDITKDQARSSSTDIDQLTLDSAADTILRFNKIPTRFKTPRSYFSDQASTCTELASLQKLLETFSNGLIQQIANLNSDAIIAIGGKEILVELSEHVAQIAGKVATIIQNVEKKQNQSESKNQLAKKLRSGAPTNFRATYISNAIAAYYQRITGKRPTISKDPYSDTPKPQGRYFYLVQEIFALLKIDANAEYYARNAAKTLRSLTRQSTQTG